MLYRIAVLVNICLLQTAFGQELEHHLVADPHGHYHVFWTAGPDSIIIEVQVKTKGWVGFGISPKGGMVGADIVIGWVLPDGTTIFDDRHGVGFVQPIVDENQDYELLSGRENATHTILRFKRPLKLCDEDDLSITDNTMKIIYSWHPEDPPGKNAVPYHGADRRGTRSILLLSPQPPPILITEDIVKWDIRVPNITLPAKHTTYMCFTVKVPAFTTQHDFIGYTMILTPGNEHLVHHLMFFECHGNDTHFQEEMDKNKAGSECIEAGTLVPPTECQPPILAWGVGSPGQSLPEGVGIPMGKKSGGTDYYFLVMHYTNPKMTAGIIDSSGLAMHLTKKPTKVHASTLQIYANVDYTHSMPPKQPSFPITTFCPSECTKNAFPPEGVNVFAVGLHTHLTGKKISLRHFRGDQELKPIAVDDSLDFDYQEVRQLRKPVVILPGDMLLGQCTYNTSERNTTTVGGYSTIQEMCFIYLSYYPAVPLSLCIGGPTLKQMADFYEVDLAEDMLTIKSPGEYQNKTMFQFLEKYDWSKVSEQKIKKLYSMQFEDERDIICQDVPVTKEGTKIVKMKYPANAKFYVPEPDVCSTSPNKGVSDGYNPTPETHGKEYGAPPKSYGEYEAAPYAYEAEVEAPSKEYGKKPYPKLGKTTKQSYK